MVKKLKIVLIFFFISYIISYVLIYLFSEQILLMEMGLENEEVLYTYNYNQTSEKIEDGYIVYKKGYDIGIAAVGYRHSNILIPPLFKIFSHYTIDLKTFDNLNNTIQIKMENFNREKSGYRTVDFSKGTYLYGTISSQNYTQQGYSYIYFGISRKKIDEILKSYNFMYNLDSSIKRSYLFFTYSDREINLTELSYAGNIAPM